MPTEIGSYEAKTHLAEIAQAVEALRNFPRLPAVPHETIRAWIEEGRE